MGITKHALAHCGHLIPKVSCLHLQSASYTANSSLEKTNQTKSKQNECLQLEHGSNKNLH